MGTYDLTTTANVKTYEGITGAGDDVIIAAMIERATGMMERLTARKLKARDYDYTVAGNSDDAILSGPKHPNHRQILILPEYPINTVTTVRINEIEYDESTSLTESGWFIANRSGGMLALRGYEFLEGYKNIELVYNAGYDATNWETETDLLDQMCLEQTLWMLKLGKKEHLLGVASIGVGDENVSYRTSEGLIPSVVLGLKPFRRLY
jgi:hypothetical protein